MDSLRRSRFGFRVLFYSLLIALFFTVGCNPAGSDSDDDPGDTVSVADSDTSDNPSTAVQTSDLNQLSSSKVLEPDASQCLFGGIQVDIGFDTNGDNELSEDEINETEFVCNGNNGSLLSVADIEPGEDCASGGTIFNSGIDMNGNGILDDEEITSGEIICNGNAGSDGSDGSGGLDVLIVTEVLPDRNSYCSGGGTLIKTGTDLNRNDILEPSEVESERAICGISAAGGLDLNQGTSTAPEEVTAIYQLGTIGSFGTSFYAVNLDDLDLPAGYYNISISRPDLNVGLTDGTNDVLTFPFLHPHGTTNLSVQTQLTTTDTYVLRVVEENGIPGTYVIGIEQVTGTGTVTGNIIDAVDGSPVSGTTVSASGATATSNSSAEPTANFNLISVPAGWRIVSFAAADGDTDGNPDHDIPNQIVNVPASGTVSTGTIGANPRLQGDDVRVILSWGDQPDDLDNHALTSDGEHVYYQNIYDNPPTVIPGISLDRDDLNKYGPETITIDSPDSRAFTFYVHNYSGIPELFDSDAVITVFNSSGLAARVEAPVNCITDYWHVLNISPTGNIEIVNTCGTSAPPNPSATGDVSGTVVNAATGDPIGGVDVSVDGGSTAATTASDGTFTITGVIMGAHTLSFSAGGYNFSDLGIDITGYANIGTVAGNPILSVGEMRVVLTWGTNPEDLDMHVITPEAEHIYYNNKVGTGIELDVDDTSSFGPETVTISDAAAGSYIFYVKNYSGSPALSQSNAKVNIFTGGGWLQTVDIANSADQTACEDTTKKYWNVASINVLGGGTVTVDNTCTASPPSTN